MRTPFSSVPSFQSLPFRFPLPPSSLFSSLPLPPKSLSSAPFLSPSHHPLSLPNLLLLTHNATQRKNLTQPAPPLLRPQQTHQQPHPALEMRLLHPARPPLPRRRRAQGPRPPPAHLPPGPARGAHRPRLLEGAGRLHPLRPRDARRQCEEAPQDLYGGGSGGGSCCWGWGWGF